MDGVEGVFVFCILYLWLVSSCEYPLILVLTLASTQLCRLTTQFSPALEFPYQTKLLETWEVAAYSFGGLSSFPFIMFLFYSRTRHWDLCLIQLNLISGLYMWQPVLGSWLEWFKSSAYYYYFCIILFNLLPLVYLDMLGFRLTYPVGYRHVPSHPFLECDKWYQSQAT